ncbi:MAG: AAA family ATPase [Clostridia bacterium]|nr:AAA family ATPase [Clostridia bacterium]
MFLKHFGMVTTPFDREIDCSALYESRAFSEALARLLYSCHRRSMAVITGEVGAGKSTLLRILKKKLDPNRYFFIYIADSSLTPRNFYTLALSLLAVESPGQLPKLKQRFKDVVTDFYEAKGLTCVIAIDEAQSLEVSMLQELRFVMNFKADSFSPLALVLSGQTEFRSTIRTLHMAPIWRRVDTCYHLGGMAFEETKVYVNHHLKMAGCSRPLFPDDVITRIQEKAKGIPAMVNILCKGCLIDAAARGQELIDAENFNRVLTEVT